MGDFLNLRAICALVSIAMASLVSQGCGTANNTNNSSGCVASYTGPEVIGQEVLINSTTEVAQSFTLTVASTPANVQLRLKAVGTPTGAIYARIETNVNGAPSGFVVENGQINATAVAAADASYSFVFSPAQLLTIGTYWVIIKGNSSFISTGVDWMATNVTGAAAYSGGSALSALDDSTWGTATGSVNGKSFLFLLGC